MSPPVGPVGKWQFTISAGHLQENMGGPLYRDPAACLMELIRNGVCASGVKDGVWEPKAARIEISLCKHPLSPSPKADTLVVLDHGQGFTEARIRKYSCLGAAIGDTPPRGSHGAEMKRIGRFATYGLGKRSSEGDPKSGFYVLTRTQPRGTVTLVSMIPAEIERNQAALVRQVDPNSIEMGTLRGIAGSFTAIVIPDSIFGSANEIREAIAYLIPRRQNQAFSLTINGKPLVPPDLARMNFAREDGRVEAFLDVAPEGEEDGIWICDHATGFRVAFGPKLGPSFLPFPYWERRLTGDIFVPDVLSNQDTGRIGIRHTFKNSETWKKAMLFLIGHSQEVQALLGNTGTTGVRGSSQNDLRNLISLCNDAFGPPDLDAIDPTFTIEKGGTPVPRPTRVWTPGTTERGSGTRHNGSGDKETRRRNVLSLRLGERTYRVQPRGLDPYILAQVEPSGDVIAFNHDYVAYPGNKEARMEHLIMSVLVAVGNAEHPGDPQNAAVFVAKMREGMLKPKKRR